MVDFKLACIFFAYEEEAMKEVLGMNFMLIGNLMRTFLNQEWLEYVESIKPDKWYPAEKLIALMNYVENIAGKEKLTACGKGIYHTIKDKVEEMGVKTPLDAIKSIVFAYPQYNRGESIGEWKILSAKEGSVTIEEKTIYDCHFSEGVVFGAIKAFGGKNITLTQSKCVKNGDDTCIIEVTWS